MIVMIVVCEACDDDKVLVLVRRCTEEWGVRGGEMFPVRGSAKDCPAPLSCQTNGTRMREAPGRDERETGPGQARPGRQEIERRSTG